MFCRKLCSKLYLFHIILSIFKSLFFTKLFWINLLEFFNVFSTAFFSKKCNGQLNCLVFRDEIAIADAPSVSKERQYICIYIEYTYIDVYWVYNEMNCFLRKSIILHCVQLPYPKLFSVIYMFKFLEAYWIKHWNS